MPMASERQIGYLSKCFAPWYSDWRAWARRHLRFEDAHLMIGQIAGMTQFDRTEKQQAAFEWVRQTAKDLGYK